MVRMEFPIFPAIWVNDYLNGPWCITGKTKFCSLISSKLEHEGRHYPLPDVYAWQKFKWKGGESGLRDYGAQCIPSNPALKMPWVHPPAPSKCCNFSFISSGTLEDSSQAKERKRKIGLEIKEIGCQAWQANFGVRLIYFIQGLLYGLSIKATFESDTASEQSGSVW